MCSRPYHAAATLLHAAQVALLFRAHRDLLEEFTYFLPDSSPPQQPQQVRPQSHPCGSAAGRMCTCGPSVLPCVCDAA